MLAHAPYTTYIMAYVTHVIHSFVSCLNLTRQVLLDQWVKINLHKLSDVMVANGIKACAFVTFFAIHQEPIIDVFCIFPRMSTLL